MSVHGVLCVLLLASVGPAWGRTVVDVPNNDLESNTCPHQGIPNTQFTVPFILLNTQYECYKPTPVFLTELNFAANTAEYRRIFQKACVQVPQVKSCIEDVARDADVCLSSIERKMFKTVRDFVEKAIDTICADDSESVARMYGDELKSLDFSSQVRVLGCMTALASKTEYKSESDIPGYTVRRYNAIRQGKECIVNVAKRKGKSADGFERFVESLLETMECVNPTTNEVVTCQSLTAEDSSSDSLETGSSS